MISKQTLLPAVLFVSLMAFAAGCSQDEATANPDGYAAQADTRRTGSEQPLNTYAAYVDEDGAISLPDDFAIDWTHMGSWALAEGDGVADMHNVYAPKRDIEYFQQHGEFADGAIIVKEVRSARGEAHTTGDAHWVEGVKVWFVMVKDRHGRFPDNPLWGDGWGWALFNGDNPGAQIATDYRKDCRDCHAPAQQTDWIYTYAYPVLGEAATASAPLREAAIENRVVQMTAMLDAGDVGGGESVADEFNISGEEAFQQCKACHSLTPGQHGVGPSLAGVYGRQVGAAEGFAYSQQMKKSNIIWTEKTLDAHLKDLNSVIPGNRMAQLFPSGVPDEAERAALISYLKEAAGE